jgi:protocatechuate 3,4-dioxygenase beta subunit
MKPDEGQRFSRASALGLLGGAVGVLASCGGGSASACAVTPEGEIGPFFADDSLAGFNRSNILANLDGTSVQSGIKLTLTVHVYDTQASCAPMPGVQIDLWHCNAAGVYSDEASEGTASQTWLRGYRLTDSTGTAKFTTIFPGWYAGRTTHIHVRARSKYNSASSTADGSNTTQVFFPQAAIDTINTTIAPYSAKGANPTTNANDDISRRETKGQTELALSGRAASGFSATASIGLPIT